MRVAASSGARSDPALAAAAEAAVRCLGVGPDEDVLVLFNEDQLAIAEWIAAAAEPGARSVRTLGYPTLGRHGEEPPPPVADAMADVDVVFAPTTRSLSHTRARMQATRRGARIATMPGITEAISHRAMSVDYAELGRAGRRIADALSAASTCRVSSPAGTDLVLDIDGRTAVVDDGNLQGPAAFGNLPAGEGYIAPVERGAEGVLVFDGSLAGFGLLDDPVRVTIAEGRAIDADGKAGRWLLQTLDAGGATGRLVAELGIGTNPAARLSGNLLEDEKVIGTAHLAFGTNTSFGGENASSVHIDGMLLEPTVELDGRLLMEGGGLLDPDV